MVEEWMGRRHGKEVREGRRSWKTGGSADFKWSSRARYTLPS